MLHLIEKPSEKGFEKCIVVGVVLPHHKRWEVEENLTELKLLARATDAEIVGEISQERQRIDKTWFIGKGKVEELKQMAEMQDAKSAIFDDDLSPAQIRNLEKLLEIKIIDRSTLILDIFARNARTREARTQVELAQLQHLLPRLTRQWTHLSRQVGGIGTKGPGETQLETDRRLIRTRIEVLRRELEKIDRQRNTRRKGREAVFKVSLVGYTNVGKSTLMNLLSDSDVLVRNQLFATLDSTVRRVQVRSNHEILLSDTVGFIRKLPHQLIESFKGTLDEVSDADLLLHVVDISHPAFRDQIATVNAVIKDLDAAETPVMMVFNKIDRLKEKALVGVLSREFPGAVFISAARQLRIEHLKEKLIDAIEQEFVATDIQIPIQHSGIMNLVHQLAVVEAEDYEEESIHVQFRSTAAVRDQILYRINNEKNSALE